MSIAVPADRIPLGMAMMLGFCLIAPLVDVASKLAAATLPVLEVSFARFVGQAVLMGAIAPATGHALRLPPGTRRGVILRAVCLALASFAFISALQVMPIADALAIAFVEPFLLLVLGALVFGDAVGPRRIASCVVGFAGALVVIRPSFAAFGWVALWPLGAALFFALYMLVTRDLSRRLHPVPMQFATAFYATLLFLPLIAWGAVEGDGPLALRWPVGLDWVWLVAVGAVASFSHMLMTLALRAAPAATLAPLRYLELITAVGFGWLVFGDFPAPIAWLGIAIIIGSGLYIVHREHTLGRRLPPAGVERVAPPGSVG